jgi:hypothetical protein
LAFLVRTGRQRGRKVRLNLLASCRSDSRCLIKEAKQLKRVTT